MVQLNVTFTDADYDTLIPLVVKAFIKNPITAKAAVVALKAKIKNKTQTEKDAMLVSFINENNAKILKTVNKKASDEGIGGYLLDFNANII